MEIELNNISQVPHLWIETQHLFVHCLLPGLFLQLVPAGIEKEKERRKAFGIVQLNSLRVTLI